MFKYILKRILFLVPTILGVIFIIYAVMNITPGDPGRAILGTGVSQEDIDAYNHALGYDQPFLQKYVNYVKKMILEQDFGISYVTKKLLLMRSGPAIKLPCFWPLRGCFFLQLLVFRWEYRQR